MEQYKQEFIEFMVDCQALKFGEFTLKSGRKSPFFMNAGAYVTGSQLMKLARAMQRQFMILMEMILTYCLDLHIRVFPSALSLQWLTADYMAKRFVTVPTVRKRRITVQIKEASWEAL